MKHFLPVKIAAVLLFDNESHCEMFAILLGFENSTILTQDLTLIVFGVQPCTLRLRKIKIQYVFCVKFWSQQQKWYPCCARRDFTAPDDDDATAVTLR